MRQNNLRRKGFFFLYDILVWLIIGLAIISISAGFLYYINRERKEISTARKELYVKSFFDQSLYYVPMNKSVSYTSDSITLNLFNGCVFSIRYDPIRKESYYLAACPPGKNITPPGGKVKVDSFTVTGTPEGVKLVICKDNACYSYFYRGM